MYKLFVSVGSRFPMDRLVSSVDNFVGSRNDIEGFALWYITAEPKEMDMRVGFGYRPDFNGLGVFIFKHDGHWRI